MGGMLIIMGIVLLGLGLGALLSALKNRSAAVIVPGAMSLLAGALAFVVGCTMP